MIKSILRPIVHSYRRSEFKWRYVDNLRPSIAYRLSAARPAPGEMARVADELARNGISITSAGALGASALFEELSREVDRFEREQAATIADARRDADIPGKKKTFIYELLGSRPTLDPQSIFVRFAVQPAFLHIANDYFGMFTHLRFYNVWHTFTTTVEARRSQLWHRDPEDWQILKVFVYLSDVDEGAGPFTYAPGTHPRGKVRTRPESFREQGHGAERSTDEQMAAVVPPDRWVTAVGAKGTVIFADTKGYHRGGLARDRDRIMYNCMYVSPGSKADELFQRDRVASEMLPREQALALRI